ncbi:MAG: hypothetical protein JNM88_20670 [Chitinophagaceae bacterium]|nr:hypothetical protein [Chitinophagaceae bacterium]
MSNEDKKLSYFTELGFFQNDVVLGRSVIRKKTKWVIIVYILLSMGIFSRQITNFPIVDINFSNLRWPVFFASLIIGFAILPYIMRRITARRPTPGLEHTLSAFGMGFFIDFASSKLIAYFS